MRRGTWKYSALALGGPVALMWLATPGAMPPVKAANGISVVTMIDGGNAFVYSDSGKRVDVGAVARPAHATPGTDFNEHAMRLLLKRGVVQSTQDSLTPQIEHGVSSWPLVGFDVEICPGGTCPQTSSLTSSTKRTPQVECEPRKDPAPASVGAGAATAMAMDNAYYVPDLLELHPGATLKKDWAARLDSRLALRAGRLGVASTIGCFTFDGPGNPAMRRQAMAHGDAGLRHDLKADSSFVDYVFSKGGKMIGRVRIKPRDGDATVLTHVSSGKLGKALRAGQYVEHFAPFYELIDLPAPSAGPKAVAAPAGAGAGAGAGDGAAADRRIKIKYTPKAFVKGVEVSPGGECPPVQFGGGGG
jgi:hypothetical protein